jgi:hypothetical protein
MVSISEIESTEFEQKEYKHTGFQVLRKLNKDDKALDVSIGFVGEPRVFDGKNTMGIRFDVLSDYEAPAYLLDEQGQKISIEDEVTGVVSDKIELKPVESFFFNFGIKENDDGEIKVSNAAKIAPILVYALKGSGDLKEDYDENNSFLSINLTQDELIEALLNLELSIKSEEREFRQKYYVPAPVKDE